MKIKKGLRILIIILCPIILALLTYLIFFTDRETRIGAANVTDSFNDTTYVDVGNSSNYLVESGQLKVSGFGDRFGDGGDGSCVVAVNQNINTGTVVGRGCGDAINYSVASLTGTTATLTTTPAAGCLSPGDDILLINQQGTFGAFPNVGNYEILVIDNVSTNVITFTASKTNYYGNGASDDTNIGTATSNQRVMVQRIPNYANVTLNGGVSWYSSVFNGTKGGVFAFKASGTVTIAGTIQSSGYGFAGAPARYYGGNGVLAGNGGESICGDGGIGGTNGQHGGVGAAGGGGGYREDPRVYGNGGNAYCGGGGGRWSNATAGIGSASSGGSGGGGSGTAGAGGAGHGSVGTSGYYYLTNSGTNGGTNASGNGVWHGGGGGGTYGTSTLSKLYFGSGGGGGGGRKISAFYTGAGGTGGGIVFISGNSVSISGAITSSGANGGRGYAAGGVYCNTGAYYGGGGGGSGGSIKIVGDSVTLGTTKVTAGGGTGGAGAHTNTCTGNWGGNGGVGRIRAEYITSVSGSTSPGASTAQLPTYENSMTLKSIDLISEGYDVQIKTFVYNLSSKPASTVSSVQFSTDTTNWYNAAGVLGSSDTLGTGVDNSIDLSGLNWETQVFYYKVLFETNGGTATPVLDDITLNYDATPAMPTIGDPTAVSTTSIRWNFTDNASNETGFKLFDGSDVLVSTVETENLSYIDEVDLSVNSQYTRKVSAYNLLGNSDLTISKSIYTLADVPTISLVDLATTTADLGSGNTTNLTSGTSGLFFDCVGEGCDTGINEWVQTGTDTVTDLSANTQYTFKVRARNGDSVETLNSSNLLTYTLTNVPTLTISDVDTSSMTLNAGNTANLTSGSSGLYFDCTGTDCDTGINIWTQSASDIVTDLNENTQYTFQVKARNGDSTETANSSSTSQYTLLNTPSIISSSVASNQIEITASSIPNKGAGSTALYFDCISEGCDTDINEWVDSSTEISTGLDNNSMYEYKVKGRNAEGVETIYSDTATFYTLPVVPTLSTTSIATNSITLSATGVSNLTEGSSGLYFDCTGEGCDTGLNDWVQITTDTATNLSINTQYTFVSKARSRNGIETGDSNMVSVYTRANTPTIPILVDRETDNVTLSVSTNSNPSNTQYLIQEVSSGKYLNQATNLLSDTPSWNTYSQLGNDSGIKVNSLNPGQTYEFKVKARNGDDVETDYGSTLSVTTLLLGPTMGTPETLSTASIRWNFTDNDTTETGFRILNSSNVEQVTCSSPDLSFCDETELIAGTGYSRKVQAYSATSQSPYSSLASGYTSSEVPGTPTLASTDSQSVNININRNGNGSSTQYLIQESQSERFVNINDGALGTTSSWSPYVSWGGNLGFDVLGLNPNETYIFRVRARNGNNVLTNYSPTATVVTRANTPINVETSDVSSTSIKIVFGINSNPASTEYVIQDENSETFLNPISLNLVSTEVWGVHSIFGGEGGITIGGLDANEDYNFRVKARNSVGVETAYSSGTGNTVIGGRIINVPSGFKALLRSNEKVEVNTDNGRQFGTKNVRVRAGEYLIADVPISFTIDRDWRNSIFGLNAVEYKSVVKLSEDEGLAGRFIMYAISGDTNAFRLCPGARSLEDVEEGCKGEILFEGDFPLEKEVEGESVTVSKAKLNDVTYWIVDGLSGTGGEGYITTEEEEEQESSTTKPISVLGDLGDTIRDVVVKASEIFEDTTIAQLDEGQLQTVATTTSLITVTVGASVAAGGFSQLLYVISQALNGVLNWVGFKRKKVQYGLVYDSYTKEPISGAVIRIYQSTGKLTDTSVTDEKGSFTGNLKPGIYRIEVKKRGFTFPSKLVKGKVDLPIQNIYHGKDFILSENDIVDLAIPLDSKSLDRGRKGLTVVMSMFGNVFAMLNTILFVGGVVLTMYMYNKYPSTPNLLLFLIYIPALYALTASLFGLGKKYGIVKNTKGKALKDVLVGIRELEFDQIVAKRVTNVKGKYRFVLPPGKYRMEILQKKYIIDNVKGGVEIQSKKEVVVNRKIVVKLK